MASKSTSDEETELPDSVIEQLKLLLWGRDIEYDVFKRWTQGFCPQTIIQ